MSIPVDVDALDSALADFGAGYLLTVSATGAVKAVTVEPVLEGGMLRVGPSKGSAANLAANPTTTLIFPPAEAKGYTLIIDGTATVTDEDICVSPKAAVLHRPASHSDGPPPPDGCQNDCSRL